MRALRTLILGFAVLAFPNPLGAQGASALPSIHGGVAAYAVPSGAAPSCRQFFLLDRDEPDTCSGFRLAGEGQLRFDGEGGDEVQSSEPLATSGYEAAVRAKRLQFLTAGVVAVGAIAGGGINAITDGPHESFHFTSEGWFGPNTYAGGADKASHFVDYTILSKELALLYDKMGFSWRDSILLGFGVAAATGFMNEIGDGTNKYGFSYEDLTMDVAGSGASALILATRTDDLFGFRHGILVPPAGSKYCCQVEPRQGRDYSNEIYTADFQFAGVERRLDWNIGPLRYLLFSVTYGTKGYPGGAADARERQVGFEIGLNFKVILNDLGVLRNTWWGYTLHIVFDNFRFPFTSVGYRYDLNHNKWIGPDNGNGFATQ